MILYLELVSVVLESHSFSVLFLRTFTKLLNALLPGSKDV